MLSVLFIGGDNGQKVYVSALFKDLDSTVAKRGSVSIGLMMVQYGSDIKGVSY